MGTVIGPFGWCVGAALLFGASPPLCKPLLEHLSPLFLAGCLYFGAGLATLPASLKRAQPSKASTTDRRRLAGAILFGGLLGPIFLLLALYDEDAGNVSLLLNLETTATVFLGWLVFRERTTWRLWCASILIIIGGLLLNVPFELGSLQASGLVFLACLSWGVDNHCTADIRDFSAFQITCIKGLFAGGLNLILALCWGPIPAGKWVLAGLLLGAVTYGGSLVLYVAAAQRIGASRSQMIFASAPYWGLLFAWYGLGEDVTLFHLSAMGLMLGALAFVARDGISGDTQGATSPHRHWHRHGEDHSDHDHSPKMWSFMGWHIHAHEHHSHHDDEKASME